MEKRYKRKLGERRKQIRILHLNGNVTQKNGNNGHFGINIRAAALVAGIHHL
jgi:hypothetical protein